MPRVRRPAELVHFIRKFEPFRGFVGFGVEHRDAVLLVALLLADRGPHGEVAPIQLMLQPRVEGEIAFVLKKDLEGPGVTPLDVISATDYLLPAIEIIDSRIADWKIKYEDTIADNASSGFFVLGNQPRGLSKVDLDLCGLSLLQNGRVKSTGAGLACLGDPIHAVVWLANTLGKMGVRIKAGEVILSGALGPVVPVAQGDHVEVHISGLGSVSCRFDEEEWAR